MRRKAALSLQTLLKVKCSKWMDQIVCGGLDVAEIIAGKVLLWMLAACAKQFSSCLSTFQQLSGLVVRTFVWRTPAWLDDPAMAGRKLHHPLKTLPDALHTSAYRKDWLEVCFELLVLKGQTIYWNDFRIGVVSLGGVSISVFVDQRVSQELWDSTLLSKPTFLTLRQDICHSAKTSHNSSTFLRNVTPPP